MFALDLHDILRLVMSDETGILRFVEFDIVNPLKCKDAVEPLRDYLTGRAVADVDLGVLA